MQIPNFLSFFFNIVDYCLLNYYLLNVFLRSLSLSLSFLNKHLMWTYCCFIADITLHNMLVLLSFNIDQCLTDFAVDHGDSPLWSGGVGWWQLISRIGWRHLARRWCYNKGTNMWILLSQVYHNYLAGIIHTPDIW